MTRNKIFLTSFAAFLITIPSAFCEPVAIGKFRDWSVFSEKRGSDTICYAATPASSKSPKKAAHGDVWFYVTSWKSGAAKSQPSLKTGYELDVQHEHKARSGRSVWSMYSSGNEAFADNADDAAIVSAIRKGSSFKVEGRSARGTNVEYSFSLSGSAAAIDKAAATCK